MIYLQLFLTFDIGVLVGMCITAWFIGSHGCYEECLLKEGDDESRNYWLKKLSRRKEDK